MTEAAGDYLGEFVQRVGPNGRNADRQQASFKAPADAGKGQTLHIICEVTDNGSPPLTRYRRVIVTFLKW